MKYINHKTGTKSEKKADPNGIPDFIAAIEDLESRVFDLEKEVADLKKKDVK